MTIGIERLRVRQARVRLDIARYAPSLLLAGYGIFVLSLDVRGEMTLYINPAYVWPTTAAGVALLIVAVAMFLQQPARTCGPDCCNGCGCETTRTRVWPYVALTLPLLLAVLFPPRGLAAFSANQRGPQIAGISAIQGASTVKRVSLSVDTKAFTMQDWVGALSADPNPKDYTGKPVQISGIVLHNPASMPPGYIMVMRYQVTCCIADARPVGLIVKDTSHGALADNQWVSVSGTMSSTRYQGDNITVVSPKSIQRIKAGDPYMY